jgi:L-alanine-DL-glutamate epimerase-like enolase superfamily enzyme
LEAPHAAAQLEYLAELGLHYCEEPLPVEQIAARASLRAGQHLPLIADDSTFTLRDLQRELAFNTFDILNIKTARTGFTESATMLSLARRAGKGVMVGSQASAGLGTLHAALFAVLPGIDYPSELSFPLKLRADILNRPLPIINGYLTVEDLMATHLDTSILTAPAGAI